MKNVAKSLAMSACILLPLAGGGAPAALAQRSFEPPVAMAEAIATAEEALPDGVAVEAELEPDHERPYYEIDIETEDGRREVIIDASNGDVFSIGDAAFGEALGRFFIDLFSDDAAVRRGDLAEAVRNAERELGARAIEAEVEGEQPTFEVELIHDGRRREVLVNIEGAVLPGDAN